MREICKSGSEGGAGQTNVPFLPLSDTGHQLLVTRYGFSSILQILKILPDLSG